MTIRDPEDEDFQKAQRLREDQAEEEYHELRLHRSKEINKKEG